jgi:PmbA protein
VEEILAKASKAADQAEVFTFTSEEIPVQFEANRLKHIQSKQSTSVSLRIIKDGRVGYSSSNDPDDADSLVEMAVETSRFGTRARFDFPGLTEFPKVQSYDPAAREVSLEKMVGLGQAMIDKLRAHTPAVNCEASIDKTVLAVRAMNSRGGEANYKSSSFTINIEGTLIRDTDMLFVGDGISSCRPILDSAELTDRVIRQLELARETAQSGRRPLPVIFTPYGVASALTSPLMAAFNGKLVLEGASPLADKTGQTLFDQKFSLADDPTIDYRPHSRPCDDECVASRRIPLIEQGTVRNFFYDLQTAGMAGTESTGSGNRGRGGLPSPSPSAFVIDGGDVSFEEMVSDMKAGIIIEQLMGADQANILGGDFSGNVLLGYKVEVGEIVGRVKNVMVSGNVYQLLGNITAVGNDSRWVGGFLNTPSLYFPSLSVAAM